MVKADAPLAVTIRPYQATDLTVVVALVRELQTHEARYHDRMLHPTAINDSYVAWLLSDCDRQQGQLIVAELARRVVGYAAVFARVPNESRDEIDYAYALIQDLAVAEKYRGRGIGRQLLKSCEAYARNAGASWLRIAALADNSGARALYENFGFSPHIVELEKSLR